MKKTRKQNKLIIRTQSGEGETNQKEFNLGQVDYDGNPEKVSVGLGLTISPREFESIRIDYGCEMYHEPGQDYREQAFEAAQLNCFNRLFDDVTDLHANGIISDHFLVGSSDENNEEDGEE